MRRSIRSFIACFLATLATSVALAQGTVSTEKPRTDQNTPKIDEITVIGELTFIAIRYQIREAEDGLYAMFNELNSTDEFDIKCRKTKVTRSYIPQRYCEPKFLTRARRANSMETAIEMRDGNLEFALFLLDDARSLREKEEANFEALNEEMLRIAIEHPEYLEMVEQVGKLKTGFAAKRRLLFGY
jgi:hypothetical protein